MSPEGWDSQSIFGMMIAILARDRLGINVDFVPVEDESQIFYAVNGCQAWELYRCDALVPWDASWSLQAAANGNKMFPDPIPDIMFGNEVPIFDQEEFVDTAIVWSVRDSIELGTLGFTYQEGLYVYPEMARESWARDGVSLLVYQTFMDGRALAFFDPPSVLVAAGIGGYGTADCVSDDSTIMNKVSDMLANNWTCVGDWMLTPACAILGERWLDECYVAIDDDWGYPKPVLYQSMVDSGMRVAKLLVGYDLYYELVSDKRFRTLFHWWNTDASFIALAPLRVGLPQHIEVQPDVMMKVAWSPVLSASESLEHLLKEISIRNVQNAELMTLAGVAMEAGWDGLTMYRKLACDWLRLNEDTWSRWLPDPRSCSQGETWDGARCAYCPPGSHGSQDEQGINTCNLCEPGFVQAESRQALCGRCREGSFSVEKGSTACERCKKGTFQSQSGRSDCVSCHTIMPGMTTLGPGAMLEADCGCQVGEFGNNATGLCAPCELGAGGELCDEFMQVWPKLQRGFSTLGPEQRLVFRCYGEESEERCPGNQLGSCAPGRRGISCAECLPGMTPSLRGECAECRSSHTLPFVFTCVIGVSVVAGMYYVIDAGNAYRRKHAVLLIAIATTQFVTVLQFFGVIALIEIHWVEPIRTILDTILLVNLDLERLHLNCVARISPLWRFVGKLGIILVAVVVMLIVHAAVVIVRHRGDFKSRWPSLIGGVGSMLTMFFISDVCTILAPLQCLEHPNKHWTLRSFPTVICFPSEGAPGEHNSHHFQMLGIGAFALLVPIGFLAHIFLVVQRFPGHMRRGNGRFLQTYAFLFVRFRAGAHWYALFLLVRNTVVAVAPVIPGILGQIFLLQIVLISSLVAVSFVKPWRVKKANKLDIVVTCVVLVVVCLAAFNEKEADDQAVSFLCVSCMVGMLVALVVTLFYGVLKCSVLHMRRFHFFLCHHKARAGAFARLLKMHLLAHGGMLRDVFIDSDNLTNLDVLFDTVASDTECLLIICSQGICTRPWCLGEMATAHASNVVAKPLYFPGFEAPDDMWIGDVANQVTDLACLAESGISVHMVQEGLRWVFQIKPVDMPLRLDAAHLRSLVMDLVDHTELPIGRQILLSLMVFAVRAKRLSWRRSELQRPTERGSTTSDNTAASGSVHSSRVIGRIGTKHLGAEGAGAVIAVDESTEAVSTAHILQKLVLPLTAFDVQSMPQLLMDIVDDEQDPWLPMPTSVQKVVFVCTGGCLLQPRFLHALLWAAERRASAMPVICDDDFEVPNKELLSLWGPTWAAGIADMDHLPPWMMHSDAVENAGIILLQVFKKIAVTFQPLGSLTVITSQAQRVADRLLRNNTHRLMLPGEARSSGVASALMNSFDRHSMRTYPSEAQRASTGTDASREDSVRLLNSEPAHNGKLSPRSPRQSDLEPIKDDAACRLNDDDASDGQTAEDESCAVVEVSRDAVVRTAEVSTVADVAFDADVQLAEADASHEVYMAERTNTRQPENRTKEALLPFGDVVPRTPDLGATADGPRPLFAPDRRLETAADRADRAEMECEDLRARVAHLEAELLDKAERTPVHRVSAESLGHHYDVVVEAPAPDSHARRTCNMFCRGSDNISI